MSFSLFDWSLIAVVAILVIISVFFVRRYTRSVADFLSANRCAGRYLLTTAQGATGVGVITYLANYEKIYNAGFGDIWWSIMLLTPVLIFMGLAGWVTYRYRETRAMTMAQFLEMRYSRRFRIFAGALCFISGILNYGIFPQITANFFIYYCGLPETVFIGIATIPTRAVVMFFFLSIGVWLALGGGLLTVLIADFFQGMFMNLFALVLVGYLLHRMGWGHMMEVLGQAPAGRSMVNPFDQAGVDSFSWAFFMMMLFLQLYSRGVWQGGAAGHTAALTPHEGRMAVILAQWRQTINYLLLLLVPISAYVFIHSPQWASGAAQLQDQIGQIADPQLQKQMLVPMAMSHIFPPGLLGMFAVIFFMAAVTTDDSSLHSWGSIFIQDVVMPLRKKALSQKSHLLLLRCSVVGVAIFAFFWGLWFPLNEYLFMYMQITGAIFLGGAGAAVIGGLYWKRGTVAGAWCGMITGAVLSVAGIVMRTFWTRLPWLSSRWAECPFNGMQISFFTALIAILCYVVVSLLTRNPAGFEMDRLLHRGKYDLMKEHKQDRTVPFRERILGITADFTRGDRFIYYFNITWAVVLFSVFIIGGIIRLNIDIPDSSWVTLWGVYVGWMVVMAVVTAVWFTLGGVRDIARLFRKLKTKGIDEHDDGRVEH